MSAKTNDIRDRVVDFRRVRAEEIAVNPKNFRRHPNGQRDALRGILKQIGVAGALLTYHSERNGGQLTLIDGELRKTDNPNLEWPVIVTDLKDEEADLLLATHDPLAAMAETDKDALDLLLRDVSTGDADIQQMLSKLAEDSGIIPPEISAPDAGESAYREQYGVIVICADEAEQEALNAK